ncbi:MAG: hypothetical protein CMM87_04355 [Rickettsiales bacterium]|nr:hypothetical protein [Rickettsiales bacterium]|tara:strand:- start:2528 stop:3517 length:990 start_codon:yes stop_codon:yes gene_type:complete
MGLGALFDGNNRVPLDRYMAWNNQQFYNSETCLGPHGHFVTAPELTPLFGYALAEWVMQVVDGFEGEITLLELGPGRGLLMQDVLMALKRRGWNRAVKMALIEQSELLQLEQKKQLTEFKDQITWFASVNDVKANGTVVILANEFFDALPIQQWCYQQGQLQQRYVQQNKGLEFVWQAAEGGSRAAGANKVFETCAVGQDIYNQCMQLLADYGGAMLMIDYGDWQGAGDTLQAIYQHQKVDPLSKPGQVDLTAHVRFEEYAKLTPEGWTCNYETQGQFLRKLGIEALFWAAIQQNPLDQARIKNVQHRLLGEDDTGMGKLFKVMEVRAP